MTEEEAYAQVASELANRDLKAGLWTKAMADSLGNIDVAKSLYLRYRAEQILSETRFAEAKQAEQVLAENRVAEEQQRKRADAEERTRIREERSITLASLTVIGIVFLSLVIGTALIIALLSLDSLARGWAIVVLFFPFGFICYNLFKHFREKEQALIHAVEQRRRTK